MTNRVLHAAAVAVITAMPISAHAGGWSTEGPSDYGFDAPSKSYGGRSDFGRTPDRWKDGGTDCRISQSIKINGAWGCWSDLAGLNWDLGGDDPITEDMPTPPLPSDDGHTGAETPAGTPPEAPAAIPLPAGVWLLLGALAGLVALRRKGGAA